MVSGPTKAHCLDLGGAGRLLTGVPNRNATTARASWTAPAPWSTPGLLRGIGMMAVRFIGFNARTGVRGPRRSV